MSEKEKQEDIELKETPDEAFPASETNNSTFPPGKDLRNLVGKTIGNHFKILELIGQGGLGVVYKAQHEFLGTHSAVKFLLSAKHLDGKHLMRFQREAKTALELHHPYIAGVQEFGVYDEAPYMVMEFVDGTPLNEVIEREKGISSKTALTILKQTAEGLSYAHQQKVIHRDIKPANILICTDKSGNVVTKIIDFGIAKIAEEEGGRNLTQTGEVFGTPNYMSPEQCQGKKADFRSDLYSLGCVAYEMLSGRPPFTGDSAIEVIMKHVNEPAKRLRERQDLRGIEEVVARLLAKDPNHRYDGAESLLADLRLIEAGSRPSRYTDKTILRRRLALVVGACIVIGAGLLAANTINTVSKPTDSTQAASPTIESLTKVIEKDPKNLFSLVERGNLYYSSSKLRNAIADYTKAIELAPNEFTLYCRRADAYRMYRDYDRSLSDCKKAIELAPNYFEAYVIRADLGLERRPLSETIQDASRAIECNPGNLFNYNARAYSLRAIAERRQGRLEEALQDINESLKLKSKYRTQKESKAWVPRAYDAKGRILLALGRPEEAIQCMDEALKEWPESDRLFGIRSMAKLADSDFQGAREDIESALLLYPDHHDYLGKKARVLIATQQIEEATEVLNHSLELHPHCSEAIAIKGLMQLKLNNLREATVYLKKAIAINSTMTEHREAIKELEQEIEKFKAGPK